MTNTPYEAVTEALRIQANIPFASAKQKKSASAAIEALRPGAMERVLPLLQDVADDYNREELAREIVNEVLGAPTEENK